MALLPWKEIFPAVPYASEALDIVVILAVAFIVERLVTRYLKRLFARIDWPPNVENGLILVARFFIILGAVTFLFRIGGLPTEWFTAFSALGGAAIGFASTRTVGNFIAGLYLLAARPFSVQDYVRIGSVEGVVNEITLNYTKILTPAMTTISLSNQRILDQDIINYRYLGGLSTFEGEGKGSSALYCYNFDAGFDPALPTSTLEAAFDKVIESYTERLPRKPRYAMTKLGRWERTYTFYLYVESPQDIFTLYPAIMKEITREWEKASKQG